MRHPASPLTLRADELHRLPRQGKPIRGCALVELQPLLHDAAATAVEALALAGVDQCVDAPAGQFDDQAVTHEHREDLVLNAELARLAEALRARLGVGYFGDAGRACKGVDDLREALLRSHGDADLNPVVVARMASICPTASLIPSS